MLFAGRVRSTTLAGKPATPQKALNTPLSRECLACGSIKSAERREKKRKENIGNRSVDPNKLLIPRGREQTGRVAAGLSGKGGKGNCGLRRNLHQMYASGSFDHWYDGQGMLDEARAQQPRERLRNGFTRDHARG